MSTTERVKATRSPDGRWVHHLGHHLTGSDVVQLVGVPRWFFFPHRFGLVESLQNCMQLLDEVVGFWHQSQDFGFRGWQHVVTIGQF